MDAQAGQFWQFVLPYAALSNGLDFSVPTRKSARFTLLPASDAGRRRPKTGAVLYSSPNTQVALAGSKHLIA